MAVEDGVYKGWHSSGALTLRSTTATFTHISQTLQSLAYSQRSPRPWPSDVMSSASFLLLAALVLSLALSHAHPASDAHTRPLNTAAAPTHEDARIKKRSPSQATTDEVLWPVGVW